MSMTIHRLVRKVVADLLSGCPVDHRRALESEILATYERVALEEEEDGNPVHNPLALARTLARRMIAQHLRERSHADLRLETLTDHADGNNDWTEAVTQRLALEQELITLARRYPRAVEAFLLIFRGARAVDIAVKMGVATATVYRWVEFITHLLQQALKHQP